MANQKNRKNSNKNDWTSKVNSDQIYQHMIRSYLYQDKLSWSRTQTLVVVEGGLLASSYYCVGAPLAVFILLFGTLIVWFIWRLIQRDWEVRDQNLENHLDKVHLDKGIKMVKESTYWCSRGSTIVRIIVYALIALNIILSICYFLLSLGVETINLQTIFGVK